MRLTSPIRLGVVFQTWQGMVILGYRFYAVIYPLLFLHLGLSRMCNQSRKSVGNVVVEVKVQESRMWKARAIAMPCLIEVSDVRSSTPTISLPSSIPEQLSMSAPVSRYHPIFSQNLTQSNCRTTTHCLPPHLVGSCLRPLAQKATKHLPLTRQTSLMQRPKI
jgi:hypothetical protein